MIYFFWYSLGHNLCYLFSTPHVWSLSTFSSLNRSFRPSFCGTSSSETLEKYLISSCWFKWSTSFGISLAMIYVACSARLKLAFIFTVKLPEEAQVAISYDSLLSQYLNYRPCLVPGGEDSNHTGKLLFGTFNNWVVADGAARQETKTRQTKVPNKRKEGGCCRGGGEKGV